MFYFSRTTGNAIIFRSGSRGPGTSVPQAGDLRPAGRGPPSRRPGTSFPQAGTLVLPAGATRGSSSSGPPRRRIGLRGRIGPVGHTHRAAPDLLDPVLPAILSGSGVGLALPAFTIAATAALTPQTARQGQSGQLQPRLPWPSRSAVSASGRSRGRRRSPHRRRSAGPRCTRAGRAAA